MLFQCKGKRLFPTIVSAIISVPRTIISFLKTYEKKKSCLAVKGWRKVSDDIKEQAFDEVTNNPFSHLRDHEAHLPIRKEKIRKVLYQKVSNITIWPQYSP